MAVMKIRAKSTGAPQFYCFDKPKPSVFPHMIELFSKAEDTLRCEDASPCITLPLGDDISSLLAILLNEDYYSMLLKGKTVLSDISVLSHTYLIPFKAKAWLDYRDRRADGQNVDEKDIRKHKNDIIRLATLLTGAEQCELPKPVQQDIVLFIHSLRSEPVNLKTLKIPGIRFEDILTVLSQVYLK